MDARNILRTLMDEVPDNEVQELVREETGLTPEELAKGGPEVDQEYDECRRQLAMWRMLELAGGGLLSLRDCPKVHVTAVFEYSGTDVYHSGVTLQACPGVKDPNCYAVMDHWFGSGEPEFDTDESIPLDF